MAEIHLEKKKSRRGMGWLWLLAAGLVAAAFIAWIALDDDDAELEETAGVAEVEGEESTPAEAAEPRAAEQQAAQVVQAGQAEGIPVAAILGDPNGWSGRTVSGEIEVASVPTDRGFWVGEGDQRLFVVLDPAGAETPYEVEQENRVRIRQATVRTARDLDTISGQLTDETRSILQDQQAYLVADGPSVELLAQR